MSKTLPMIKGFDPMGEPELRHAEHGGLELVFSTLPPTTKSGEARAPHLFDTFERVLQDVLLTTVLRDDRERFLIGDPYDDTAETLATYLSNFWKDHAGPVQKILDDAPRQDAVFRNDLEFREVMRDNLEPIFKPHGFRSSIAQLLSFTRRFQGGSDMTHVFMDGRNDVTRVEPCVKYGVQHETLERLVSICCEAEKKHLKHKQSSGSHRVAMPPDAPVVSTPADAVLWAKACASTIETQVLEGLARWRNLDAISAVLNNLKGGAENYDKLPSSYQYNGARGVLIAKLLDDPKLVDIIAFHKQFIGIDDPNNYFQIYLDRCFAKACELARGNTITELKATADAY